MFAFYFIIAVLCTTFLVGVAHFSIQQGQWFDLIFKWQDKLYKLGEKQGVFNMILYKVLGGCSYCFCHFVSVISFIIFAIVMYGKGLWFTSPSIHLAIIANIAVYVAFISSSTSLGFIHITKWMSND